MTRDARERSGGWAVEVRAGGVAVVALPGGDSPSARTLWRPELERALDHALGEAERAPNVRAVVLRSSSARSFLEGPRVTTRFRFATDAEAASRDAARSLARLSAKGRKPVVACVHGAALGAGFELALACTAAVASDDPSTVFGFSEVDLGLMPSGNGLLRVAERAGLRVAMDLGTTGRRLDAQRALGLGLVDEVVSASAVVDAACALARQLADDPKLRRSLARARRDASGRGLRAIERALVERNPVGRRVLFARAMSKTAEKTRGHYPAVPRMLAELSRYGTLGFRAAAKREARFVGELVVSETAQRLGELAEAIAASDSDPGLEPGEAAAAETISRAAVVGAGIIGAGIACATVLGGVPVRLKERDGDALDRALRYVDHVLETRERDGKSAPGERSSAFARLAGATRYTDLAGVDVVIEAVFEDIALKHEVLREVEKHVSPTCLLASSTASIPIAHVAAACAHPERVVGMRYAHPVDEARLVEVVRTSVADPRAIATAVALAKRQGKTVIVVRDGTGFYTTRILIPLLHEALRLVEEGVPVDAVDDALVDWGFPVGPLHWLDEHGIDIAAHLGEILHAAFGERMRVPSAMAKLRTDERKGRRNGRGFYLYGHGHRAERRVDDTVYGALGVRPDKSLLPEEISLRCALPMVNEALRCLDEGIIRSPRDGDVGAVLGVAFPAFRGGPFRYVDVLGAPEVLRRTRALANRFGDRFDPAPRLVALARNGGRLYG